MSWIKDVAHELKELDVTRKSLRKFGVTVGAIFLVFGLLLMWRGHWPSTRELFVGFGAALLIGGFTAPERLIHIYKIWMGFAFALGWVISRFILILLFIVVLTPIGLLAKLFGKEFLDLKFKDGKDSYWISKEKRKIDYEKMY